MRSLFLKTAVSVQIIAMSSAPALAQSWGGGGGRSWGGGWGSGGRWGSGGGSGGGWSGGGHVAPEIDASSGMLAAVALTAILLFVLERRNQAKAVKAEAGK